MALKPRSLEDITAEQLIVQGGRNPGEGKDRLRNIEIYDNRLIEPQGKYPLGRPYLDFLKETLGEECSGVQDLLDVLSTRNKRPATWVEMGGGFALPMKKLKQEGASARMINVDLFETMAREECEVNRAKIKEVLEVDVDRVDVNPEFIRADITDVQLPVKPDLITSVENLQYLDEKIAALCHWYNCLEDDGVMIVYVESLTDLVRRTGVTTYESFVFDSFLEALKKSQISAHAHNYSHGTSHTPSHSRLTIIKKPGTKLNVVASLKKIGTTYDGYKYSYYDTADGVIEVTEN